MTLLGTCTQATFFVLLHTYTGDRYIATGGPYAARDIKSTQPMLGCFATVLPMVADVSADKLFGDFLEEVRRLASCQTAARFTPHTSNSSIP